MITTIYFNLLIIGIIFYKCASVAEARTEINCRTIFI